MYALASGNRDAAGYIPCRREATRPSVPGPGGTDAGSAHCRGDLAGSREVRVTLQRDRLQCTTTKTMRASKDRKMSEKRIQKAKNPD